MACLTKVQRNLIGLENFLCDQPLQPVDKVLRVTFDKELDISILSVLTGKDCLRKEIG